LRSPPCRRRSPYTPLFRSELEAEIAALDQLVALAVWVRDSGTDRKWAELRTLLLDRALLRAPDGTPRKLIVFTEHRDTLDHLATDRKSTRLNSSHVSISYA